MHTPSKLLVTLLAGAFLSLPAVSADATPTKAGAVATVNGTAIPESTFDTFYAEQKGQGAPDSAELRNAVREELIRRVPLGRIGTADDVAGAVSYLLGDDSSYVTGAILRIAQVLSAELTTGNGALHVGRKPR